MLVGRSFGGFYFALRYTKNAASNSISVAPAVMVKSLLLRYRHACIPAAFRGRFFKAAYAAEDEAAPAYEYASGNIKREGLGVTKLHETQFRDNGNNISMKWCRRDKEDGVVTITVPVVGFRAGKHDTKRVRAIVNNFRTSFKGGNGVTGISNRAEF